MWGSMSSRDWAMWDSTSSRGWVVRGSTSSRGWAMWDSTSQCFFTHYLFSSSVNLAIIKSVIQLFYWELNTNRAMMNISVSVSTNLVKYNLEQYNCALMSHAWRHDHHSFLPLFIASQRQDSVSDVGNWNIQLCGQWTNSASDWLLGWTRSAFCCSLMKISLEISSIGRFHLTRQFACVFLSIIARSVFSMPQISRLLSSQCVD